MPCSPASLRGVPAPPQPQKQPARMPGPVQSGHRQAQRHPAARPTVPSSGGDRTDKRLNSWPVRVQGSVAGPSLHPSAAVEGGCGAPWQRRPASCAQEIHGTAGERNWGNTATHSLPWRRYRPARRGWPASLQHCLGLVVLHQPACIPVAPLLPDSTPPEAAQPWLRPLPNARCLLCVPPSLSAQPVPAFPGSSAGRRHQSPCFDPILACPHTGPSLVSA